MGLKGRSHAQLALERYLVGGREEPANGDRPLGELSHPTRSEDLLVQIGGPHTPFCAQRLEARVHLDELTAVQHMTRVSDGEQRLDAARATSDEAQRACRRDRQPRRVPR